MFVEGMLFGVGISQIELGREFKILWNAAKLAMTKCILSADHGVAFPLYRLSHACNATCAVACLSRFFMPDVSRSGAAVEGEIGQLAGRVGHIR